MPEHDENNPRLHASCTPLSDDALKNLFEGVRGNGSKERHLGVWVAFGVPSRAFISPEGWLVFEDPREREFMEPGWDLT